MPKILKSKYFWQCSCNCLGETTRRGFYVYDDKRKASPDTEIQKYIEKAREISGVTIDPKVHLVSLCFYVYKYDDEGIFRPLYTHDTILLAVNKIIRQRYSGDDILACGERGLSSTRWRYCGKSCGSWHLSCHGHGIPSLQVCEVACVIFFPHILCFLLRPSLFIRGGIMFWADSLGSKYICSRLEQWSNLYGGFFKPCSYLAERAAKGAPLVRILKLPHSVFDEWC